MNSCSHKDRGHEMSQTEIVAIHDPDDCEQAEAEIRRLRTEVEALSRELEVARECHVEKLQRATQAEAEIRRLRAALSDMLNGDCLPGCRTEYASGCNCWTEKAQRALAR